MAYMNLNTFELIHDIVFTNELSRSSQELKVGVYGYTHPPLQEPQSSWVYIDDFIAPTISELNRKGYRTVFSCSGHAEKTSLYIPKYSTTIYDIDTLTLHPSAYISFDDGISIPEDMIPSNWEYDKDCNSIYFHYDIYPIFTSEITSNSVMIQKNQIIISVMADLFAEIEKWQEYSG